MGASNRYRKSRAPKRKPPKKRSFQGNNLTTESSNESEANLSASASKINVNLAENAKTVPNECYLIVNSKLLINLLSMIGKCPECYDFLDFEHLISRKQGLSNFFDILCKKCGWNFKFCTSNKIKNEKTGTNNYEINIRAVMASRENGMGHKGLSTFCNFMNMPKPMNYSSYANINSNIHIAYSQVAR